MSDEYSDLIARLSEDPHDIVAYVWCCEPEEVEYHIGHPITREHVNHPSVSLPSMMDSIQKGTIKVVMPYICQGFYFTVKETK